MRQWAQETRVRFCLVSPKWPKVSTVSWRSRLEDSQARESNLVVLGLGERRLHRMRREAGERVTVPSALKVSTASGRSRLEDGQAKERNLSDLGLGERRLHRMRQKAHGDRLRFCLVRPRMPKVSTARWRPRLEDGQATERNLADLGVRKRRLNGE